MGIIDKIQELCEETDITILRLEKDLCFSKSIVYTWKNSSPSIDKICKIADYFNVSVDYILERTKFKSYSNDEWNMEEFKEIENYKNFVRMKRNNKFK